MSANDVMGPGGVFFGPPWQEDRVWRVTVMRTVYPLKVGSETLQIIAKGRKEAGQLAIEHIRNRHKAIHVDCEILEIELIDETLT